ncbi:ZIP family metal transporter [Aporhodopirellula aestuarii]|uniref:ZIP family metal transporter n=1 Tax=Aporhodopirellula aestuarii TaxID=2950107 RepID=A0ABT0U6K3_9BACT|nr:ZIP family metal transporter [Aporhodopirellula aestuarii]MCM2372525.1 ZIP family metal transporter [Aporhodopirellula aestuarii]
MIEWLHQSDPIWQALFAGGFTWALTALGAALVFGLTNVHRKLFDAMLGFAGGVMLAASYWSLLAPSIDVADELGWPSWFPAAIGFLLGGGFLYGLDRILPHLHRGLPDESAEGLKTAWQRSVLLISAITLHNIPEGLAVGVAFGSAGSDLTMTSLGGATALAIGIGLQNVPEGVAVAVPLRAEGMSRSKSWLIGQASAIVEPVAAVIGAAVVVYAAPVLPFALSFAAGAMVYVVVEELVPETQQEGNEDVATLFLMLGFAIMMILDVSLG